MNPEYKKYSLENLDKWVRDALITAEVTPQEIYTTIRKVVEEEYYYFKHHTGRCYDLLALLNGDGKEKIETLNKYKNTSSSQYTEEELNSMCDNGEKENSNRVHPDYDRNRTYDDMIAAGYIMTADGFWIK